MLFFWDLMTAGSGQDRNPVNTLSKWLGFNDSGHSVEKRDLCYSISETTHFFINIHIKKYFPPPFKVMEIFAVSMELTGYNTTVAQTIQVGFIYNGFSCHTIWDYNECIAMHSSLDTNICFCVCYIHTCIYLYMHLWICICTDT